MSLFETSMSLIWRLSGTDYFVFFGNSTKNWYIYQTMSKNTSISLGSYFDQFVKERITQGRYKNVSEVIRAGLRLLEEEEQKTLALKKAIQDGIDSGIAHDFEPAKHLKVLKAGRRSNG